MLMLRYLIHLSFLFLTSIGILSCSKKQNATPPPVEVRILQKDPSGTITIQTLRNELQANDQIYFDLNPSKVFEYKPLLTKDVVLKSEAYCQYELESASYSHQIYSNAVSVYSVLPPQVFHTPTDKAWSCNFKITLVHSNLASSIVYFKNKFISTSQIGASPTLYSNLHTPLNTKTLQESDFPKAWLYDLDQNEKAELLCETFESSYTKDTHAVTSFLELASNQKVQSFLKETIDPRIFQPSQKCRVRIQKITKSLISDVFTLNFKALKPIVGCNMHQDQFRFSGYQVHNFLQITLQNPYSFPLSVALLSQTTLPVGATYDRGGGRNGGSPHTYSVFYPVRVSTPPQDSKTFDDKLFILIPAHTTTVINYAIELKSPSIKETSFKLRPPNALCTPFILSKNFQSLEDLTNIGFYSDPN